MSAGTQNIGFGTYRLNGEDATNATIHALETGGYRWIDTAPLYGNQQFVGDGILKSGVHRNNFSITTKISRNTLNLTDSKAFTEAFFKSLKDLKTDYVDEVILHEPIDVVRNWKNLCDLYMNEGKGLIRSIGVSNFGVDDLKEIMSLVQEKKIQHVPAVNQIEITPFLTRGDLPGFCREHKIEIVAHSPLAKGEKANDPTLKQIASNYDVSWAQLMLRWGIQHGYRVIPRSKNKQHIGENLGLLFDISKQDMGSIDALDCGYATHPKYLRRNVVEDTTPTKSDNTNPQSNSNGNKTSEKDKPKKIKTRKIKVSS